MFRTTLLFPLLASCLFWSRVDPVSAPVEEVPPSEEMPPGQTGVSGTTGEINTCPASVLDPSAPVVFFSDLTSGPKSGGLDDLGVFVTLYGERFGATAGRVTFGGADVARVVSWSENAAARGLDVIVVQLGPGAADGTHDFVVTANDKPSNGLAFTVRAGRILLLDTAASTNAGTFGAPFSSFAQAKAALAAGDTLYVKGTLTGVDPDDTSMRAALFLSPNNVASGTATAPIAVVGYPGARPTIGDGTVTDCYGDKPSGIELALGSDDRTLKHWTLAGLRVGERRDGLVVAGENIRAVDLRLDTLCTDLRMTQTVLGASLLAIDAPGGALGTVQNIYFGDYFQTTTQRNVELAYSDIGSASEGYVTLEIGTATDCDTRDISLHDNVLRGGFSLVRVIKNQGLLGAISFHNNVLTGAAFEFAGYTGALTLTHNTFAQSAKGFVRNDDAVFSMVVTNNVFAVTDTLDDTMSGVTLSGASNLWLDEVPAFDATGRAGPAGFNDPTLGDYRLPSASSYRGAGAATTVCADALGVVRPATPTLGAFESPP